MRDTSDPGSVHLLFLLTSKSIGGAEVHAISLANDLRRCEFRVSLVFLKEESDGPDFVKLADGIASFSAGVKSKVDRAAIAKLRAFVERESVDVIVCINPFPLLYAVAIRQVSNRQVYIGKKDFTRRSHFRLKPVLKCWRTVRFFGRLTCWSMFAIISENIGNRTGYGRVLFASFITAWIYPDSPASLPMLNVNFVRGMALRTRIT